MRDPNRIDDVLAAVKAAWEQYPDLRLTQLLFNIASGTAEAASQFYNREDEDLMRLLARV